MLKDNLQKQILVNFLKMEVKRSSGKVISSQVVNLSQGGYKRRTVGSKFFFSL